jgi:hypothetical protein
MSSIWEKGDRPSIMHVSLLIKNYKKINRLFSMGMLLAPAHGVPVGTNTPNIFAPMGTLRPDAKSTAWSTSCPKYLKHIDCHGFKR